MKAFRGTYDQLPSVRRQHASVESCARRVLSLYQFEEVSTPIFEYLDVFVRTLGETSDVVTKEMFTFRDRHEDLLALRPEGTAGVMRAVLTNQLVQSVPLKYFYTGPMFRYERPQKGRMRQFHQVGVEHIGEAHPLADAECIAMGAHFLRELNLSGTIELEVNTLGDEGSRQKYRHALVNYFSLYEQDLSPDSKERLQKNPLRILDSKDEMDQRIVQDAPKIQAFLTPEAEKFFESVLRGLEALKVPFQVNPRLVRGLDYYGHTAFEFRTSSLGAQNTVLAGGRYDGLSVQMGGPRLPSVGWSAGIERLVLLLSKELRALRPVALIPLGEAAENKVWTLAQKLRKENIPTQLAYDGSLKSRMKKANRAGASHALILGEEELQNDQATLKDLDLGTQKTIEMSQLLSYLKAL
ncbi:MAG: histidine--tRNA ligase [Alphaproteobacteria bacterium RIFCSPHIGHO2_01_FULL_41_14]|nr:MAG: histidine--tRNA ligase [Alphaproteobacteria bacterium GWB1_45_5]OFW76366.1 MAG: histidine--tRNA ligase [Alphaproteobacteria bacterium GWA1_45_9]OFW89361.1 MAG: histidine--tRNA ligase [Alphaproteobacteria bacterium RIFCSPHIGHO2_01_FULL_41_14]HCI48763.1 histidine--tRNA ligase [Holosporales bacterium]